MTDGYIARFMLFAKRSVPPPPEEYNVKETVSNKICILGFVPMWTVFEAGYAFSFFPSP